MIDKLKQLGLFFAGLMTLYFLVDLFLLPLFTRHGDEFELIDFSEHRVEKAMDLAADLNVELIIADSAYTPVYESGVIIAQRPKAFSHVKEGRRVYVTVSKGDRPIKVPDLVGESEQNAKFVLQAEGLILGDIEENYSTKYPKGVVIRQSLPYKSSALTGDTVAITVSLGIDYSQIPIENYVGKTFTRAKKLAEQRRLIVKKELGEKNGELVPGTVVKQSITPGQRVGVDTVITFTISQY